MSFKKSILSVVAAAAVTTSAFAGSNVNLSMTGKGDYLNYPAYYATTDGWATNIRVVNTNTTNAVVAKVVVREYKTSKELLDFPIYLSPGDVWTADLTNSGAINNVTVSSADDSSPEVPMSQGLNDNGPLESGNDLSHGYVEILAIAAVDAASVYTKYASAAEKAAMPLWTPFHPLPKAMIKSAFNDGSTSDVTWVQSNDDLFGQELITSATSGAEKSMTLPATAMTVTGLSTVTLTGLFGVDTTANSIWDNSTNAPLAPANAGSAACPARSGITETIEDQIRCELETQEVHVINYTDAVGETQLLLTQAYKHTNPDANATNLGNTAPYFNSAAGSVAHGHGLFYFGARGWDESENTPTDPGSIYSGSITTTVAEQCPTEICYLYTSDDSDYTSGWVNFTLGTNSDLSAVVGKIPTIATVLSGAKVNGKGITNIYGAAITK